VRVVVGGGAVGLAVAAALAERGEVLLLERHAVLGLENSSHNSGVIHAGIYYPTGSLKHRLCLEGNALLYDWSARRGVRVRRTGKLIIATGAEELSALDAVEAQARRNGVPGLRRLTKREAAAFEPDVACVAALFSETSGVVDQAGYIRSLAADLTEKGGLIALKHDLTGATRAHGGGFRLEMRDPDGNSTTMDCEAIVNSAGLAADRVAALLGYDLDGGGETPRLRQTINKGRYYDIVDPEKARRHRHLVYPVPEHGAGGLGVHVTVDIDGGVHIGPDTEWLSEGAPLDFRADDSRREAFWRAARRYLPDLDPGDIAPGQVGYRPKLQRPGEEQQDFLIWHDRGYVHLGGIESPGLTASLAIARRVAELLA
jgi:L-2-hydroxyglutarate oxidase LhgO